MSDNNEEIKRIIINQDGAKCSGCDEYLGEDEVGEWCEKCEEDQEDGIEDCEDCGYTHHYEDKCPIGEQCEKYEKWREDEDDVPCFPAEAYVPDIPANKQKARDVDGVLWQYDAGEDRWNRLKDEERKCECVGCHTLFSPTDLNAIGLSISLCNKCYCQKKLNESYERCAILKAEHQANLQIIKDKVKGKIRAAQSRNKAIREMLKDEEYRRDPWYNGGVW